MNKDKKPEQEPVYDPGKGKRTVSMWRNWLTNRWGFQRQMLNAMQSKPMYQGTVDPVVKAKRRAKNKVARRSRRINRMVAKR